MSEQIRPDFSGEWILNRPASTLSNGADTTQSAVWRIEHREPVFHHQASMLMADGPREFEYELQSDVPDSGLQWDGDVLVVTFTNPLPEGEMTISFRYELLDDGRRLRASEAVRGVPWAQDNVWIFDLGGSARKPGPPS
jgi:hypothetical protein